MTATPETTDRAAQTPKDPVADLDQIAARAADDPFYVSDCEGSLQVWREKALTGVRRDAAGEIEMYSFPSTYKVTDQIIELDLSTWDPGEDATDDQQRQDINDLVDARAALPGLVEEIAKLRAQVKSVRDWATSHEYRWLHELLDGYGAHGGHL
jgi:hypothetical protein